MTTVVVVESPAKAKTINKYLGDDYFVIASYGHIRDLPPRDGSVRPEDGFSMDWEVDARSEKHIKDIVSAVKKAKRVYLATDPDREGEAISWHVQEVLRDKKVLEGVDVRRITFNQITKAAVREAIENPRGLHDSLIEAYLARRALDYLVGFTLSPVLWRKLPGSKSAGRVQSVALRLICERESEIEKFIAREYWTVEAGLNTAKGAPFTARLTHLDGNKLDKFDLNNEAAALDAVSAIKAGKFQVAKVERKKVKRNPAAPFITSTLQQEAARKLHFSAKRTMQVAQRLYEGTDIGGETVGLITYMRTDGVTMAPEAVQATRQLIGRDYGDAYLPDSPRMYKSKAKNAQEAHECVRPTDVARTPREMARYLEKDHLKLYELIWKRTIACQMAPAELDQVAVDVSAAERGVTLRATGSVIAFDGFLKVYREGRDEPGESDDDNDRILPPMTEGDAVAREKVTPEQHFTQPPPRYSEASLVKRLEELGIGRPSTYASILSVLQDREYVRLDSRRFVPEDRGRMVTSFLLNFFHRLVEYDFTANLETRLDEISAGDANWKSVLSDFWSDFSKAVEATKGLTITEVLDALDAELGPHFFPANEDGSDPRACPSCKTGRLGLRLGKMGGFIGCSNYPDCRHTRPLTIAGDEQEKAAVEGEGGTKELGTDPETGKTVYLKHGPYGFYVQLGEQEPAPPAEKGKKKPKVPKPKRASIPKKMPPGDVDLDIALGLLALPREVGPHPESGEPILAGLGRFGPYLKHGDVYKSLTPDDDVLTVGLNRAVDLLAQARPAKKEIGKHPDDNKPITVHAGRFGPYVQHGTLRATLPKGTEREDVTLEQAVELLKAKAERDGKAPAKKTTAKKAPAKKTTAKKTTAKKTPAKKPATKKAGTSTG